MAELNNNRLETSRLYLIPLDYDQLLKYRLPDGSLESELGLMPRKREVSEELLMVLDRSIIPFINLYPANILYGTLWIIVHKTQNLIVGDIGFKGAPTDKGLLEIGYATYPEFFNNGFMTEALCSITNWAFSRPEVQIILAETDKGNLASQKILNKNKFIPFAETAEMYWWRLDRNIDETELDK